MSLTETIKEQEKEFNEKWYKSFAYGGFKTLEDVPPHKWDYDTKLIKNWHKSSIKQILQSIIDREEKEKKAGKSQIYMPAAYNPDNMNDIVFCAQHSITDSYNQSKQDTISYLQSQLKELE